MPDTRRGPRDSMVRHIDLELQELKDLILQMGGYVEKAIECSTNALFKFNREDLLEVERNELRINEKQIQIDEACVNVLAKQAPVARDLRLVIAIVKINTDLERMGDQSVNIAATSENYSKSSAGTKIPAKLQAMVGEVQAMVRSALDSFARQDVDLAHHVLTQDDAVDSLKDEMLLEARALMEQDPKNIESSISLILSSRNLERMADHATNIAEEVIYLATGADVRHGGHGAT